MRSSIVDGAARRKLFPAVRRNSTFDAYRSIDDGRLTDNKTYCNQEYHDFQYVKRISKAKWRN